MVNTNLDFPEALKELRAKAGLSYGDIAAKTGFSASYINDLEKRRLGVPKMENISRIAKAFNISPEYFKEYRLYLCQKLAKDDPDFERKIYTLYQTQKPREEMEEAKSDDVS